MLSLLRSSCLKQARPLLLHSLRSISTSTTITTPAQLPKLMISPGSAHHNSLPSFLEYADRVNLAPSKTVYVGTHYEYIAALSLMRLGFSLLRTGKRSDAGIDLIGHWILPPLPEPLPVIVQCKAMARGLSPRHVRELEGAFQGIPAEWRKKEVLGLLVSTNKATKGVLETLGLNRHPMGFLKVSRSGQVEQFLWNKSAAERGLEGVGVTIRHTPRIMLPEHKIEEQGEEGDGWVPGKNVKRNTTRTRNFRDPGTSKDVQLTWMGQPIFPDRESLDEETKKLGDEIARVDDVVQAEKTAGKGSAVKVTKRAASKTAVKGKDAEKEVPQKSSKTSAKRGRGRPPASPNNHKVTDKAVTAVKRGPGRPKGSKNKVKD